MWEDVRAFIALDPAMWLLCHFRPAAATIISLVVVAEIVAGLFAFGYAAVFDVERLKLVPLVLTPVIGAFYYWQPRGFVHAAYALDREGLLPLPPGQLTAVKGKALGLFRRPNVGYNFVIHIVLFLLLVGIMQGVRMVTSGGRVTHTFTFARIDGAETAAVCLYQLFNALNVYMVTWIAIRQVVATELLYKWTAETPMNLVALHGDGRNGCAGMGRYLLRVALGGPIFAISVVFVAFFAEFWVFNNKVSLFQSSANTWAFVIIVLVCLAMVPLLLLLPLLVFARAMQAAKREQLREPAERIRRMAASWDPEEVRTTKDAFDAVNARYQWLRGNLFDYPLAFRITALKVVAVSVLVPIGPKVADVLVSKQLGGK